MLQEQARKNYPFKRRLGQQQWNTSGEPSCPPLVTAEIAGVIPVPSEIPVTTTSVAAALLSRFMCIVSPYITIE
jgi:hypothetical protein